MTEETLKKALSLKESLATAEYEIDNLRTSLKCAIAQGKSSLYLKVEGVGSVVFSYPEIADKITVEINRIETLVKKLNRRFTKL